MTEPSPKRSTWWWGFLWGLGTGMVLSVGTVLLWRSVTENFRYRYVAARDMALVKSPDVQIGIIPRGTEVVTMRRLDFFGDDYGSDAWIRVGIQISDARNQGLATFEDARLKEQGVPDLWLRELKTK